MKILVDELYTTLEQPFSIIDGKVHHWKGVRPYLYAHNHPSGTFTIELISGASSLTSVNFTASDLYSGLSTSDNFIHLYYRLLFPNVLPLKNGTYSLKLSASGYSFSEPSYLGWIREHEDIKFPTYLEPADH